MLQGISILYTVYIHDDYLYGTDVLKIFDSLNSHLHRKNLVPESICQCGAFEGSYHFLFVCPRYANARKRYLPENLITIQQGIFYKRCNLIQFTKTGHCSKASKNLL